MIQFPKYIIKKAADGQFYWVLCAQNGQVLITSETYTTKQNCQSGIESSKINVEDSSFKRLTAEDGQTYFTQVAKNHEVLAVSEMYVSTQGRDNGISSVIENAPIANVEENS